MAKLTDEQRRALRIMARHPHGCAEALLLDDGFQVGQLTVLVLEGLAFARFVRAAARQRVWMEITEAGRKAIGE
jgi:hypothetical protein